MVEILKRQQQLSELKKSSKEIMEGELKRAVFRCSDGHKYYKAKSDVGKTKLYLRCYKHCEGCRARIHTEYADRDEKNLRVIYKNGVHTHPACSDVNRNKVIRKSESTKETCNTLKTEHRNVPSRLKYVVYIY